MVKSKRAREAAESAAEPVSVEAVNGTSATPEKLVKKRKRDVEEDAAEEDPSASDKKKSKKEKKDKKDKKDKKNKKHDKESRKEKKDKRKNLQDLPEEVVEDAADQDETPQEAATKVSSGVDGDAEAKKKEEKRARKQAKRDEKKQRQEQTEQGTVDSTSKSNGKPTTSSATAPSGTSDSTDNPNSAEDPIDLNDTSANDKKDRHIVFVGNLPFSATAASISAHFASLSPVAVRCLRNRDDPNPCRGIAFVEFSKVWHQRTCLDKFHHSTFDDGVSPARKINVELTAGGGGKTKQRQQKIKDKNKKLDENRAKRIEREKVAKEEGGADANKSSHQEGFMHPSRRARIPGGGW